MVGLLMLGVVLLSALLALLTRRLWGDLLSLRQAPRFPVPKGLALSAREQIIYRYYLDSLKPLTKVMPLGNPESRALHEVYLHAQLCDVENRSAGDQEVINIHEAIDACRGTILLTGEPGAGKSILARYLVNRMLEPDDLRLDPNLRSIRDRHASQWIPIFADLRDDVICGTVHQRDMGARASRSFEQWLAAAMLGRLGQPETLLFFDPLRKEKEASSLLGKILGGGYGFVIVDGLEHVTSDETEEVPGQLFLQDLQSFAQSDGC